MGLILGLLPGRGKLGPWPLVKNTDNQLKGGGSFSKVAKYNTFDIGD